LEDEEGDGQLMNVVVNFGTDQFTPVAYLLSCKDNLHISAWRLVMPVAICQQHTRGQNVVIFHVVHSSRYVTYS
jgi:hypothetical protein